MPAVNASGDVFSLSGDARYEGVVNGRAGAAASLSVSLEAETCHGYSLEASANALAEVNGALSLLLAVRGTAFATAAAGVNAKIQFKPDLFERFGVIVDAAAYAEASAGFRLAVGLDFALLAQWGKSSLSGAAQEIFLAFLQEIVVEAGVWGRISAAAMAQAHVDITLSLADEQNAGFIIEAGAAVGLGAGTGWDFYGAASFTDVRRFYRSAARIIGREAGSVARAALPAELRFGADVIELLLPVALNAAYEIGQTTALQSLVPTEQLVGKLGGCVAMSVRDFAIARVLDVGRASIEAIVEQAVQQLESQALGEAGAARFEDALQALTTFVAERQHREAALEDLPELALLLGAVVETALPDSLYRQRDTIALLWTALAMAKALADFVPALSGSIGIGGVTDAGAASAIGALPAPPALVLDAYREALGRELVAIEYRDAIDYLVAIGIEPLLDQHAPAASRLLGDLARRLELGTGELVELAFGFALGSGNAPLQLWGHLRGFIVQWLDDTLLIEVLPRLRDTTGAAGSDYVREVVEPSLAALSSFLVVKLDALVAGIGADQEGPFVEKLSAGCSTVIYRVFARNLVFFEHLLFEHLLDSFESAFRAAAELIAQDPAHTVMSSLRTVLPLQMPHVASLLGEQLDAVQQLAADVVRIGIDAFGPGVWSAQRRARYARLKREALLGFDGNNAFADETAAENFVRELVLCSTVPNTDAIGALAEFIGEQLVREAEIIVPRGVIALQTFALRVTRGVVAEIDRRAREFLLGLAALADAALAEFNRWLRLADEALQAAQAAGRSAADALERVADELRSDARRRAVKDSLYALGAREAERRVRAIYGDPQLVDLGENEAVAAAVGLFHLAFQVAVPVIELALDAAAAVADGVAAIIDAAVDASEAAERLLRAVVDAALAGVTDALGALGITLPAELSAADIATAIADALPLHLLVGLLDALILAQQDLAAQLQAQQLAETQRDSARAEQQRAAERDRGARASGPITIQIASPLALPPRLRDLWRHGRELPAVVRIGGASAAFFQRGQGRRVRLALNGLELHYEAAAWTPRSDARFEWQSVLRRETHPLAQGLNVLEVTVTPGDREQSRATVAFLVDFAGPGLNADLVVDPDASTLDTAGNDHEQLLQERIGLRSRAPADLQLAGWRVCDAQALHTYRFGAVTLVSDAPLALVTGGAPQDDGSDTLFWGRRAAVWNNTGDVVSVVDDRGVLRAQYRYEPGG